MSPRLLAGAARTAVASVWLYEGLWCKLLAADAGQRAIVGRVPGIGDAAGFALAAALVPAWRDGPLREFLHLADPEAQLRLWRRHLDRPALRSLMFAAFGTASPLTPYCRRDSGSGAVTRLDR